ncbi:hypothetical protein ACS0TY_033806 [Phlomoides rotata]
MRKSHHRRATTLLPKNRRGASKDVGAPSAAADKRLEQTRLSTAQPQWYLEAVAFYAVVRPHDSWYSGPAATKKYGRHNWECVKVREMTGLKLSALNNIKTQENCQWSKCTFRSTKMAVFRQLKVRYETGDHVGVYYENLIEIVEQAEKLLNLPPQTYYSIHVDNKNGSPRSGSSLPPLFPPCTLKTALTRYAYLLSAPKKSVLTALASYASDPSEDDRLRYLASPSGKDSSLLFFPHKLYSCIFKRNMHSMYLQVREAYSRSYQILPPASLLYVFSLQQLLLARSPDFIPSHPPQSKYLSSWFV